MGGERSEPAALRLCVTLRERERGGKRSPLVEHSMNAAGGDCFRLCATQPGTVVA